MVKNIEIIERAIDFLKNGLWNGNAEMIKAMLFEFSYQNTKDVKPIKNLSVWDCVANDKDRPVMCAIYHDSKNKVAVGSDGHVMFINPDEYQKRFGKDSVINKDGSKINDRYPVYEKCIPADKDLVDVELFDVDTLLEKAKMSVAVSLLSGAVANLNITKDSDGNNVSARLIPYMASVGVDGWKKHKDKPVFVKRFEGKTLLVCGMV